MKVLEDLLKDTIEDWVKYSKNFVEDAGKKYEERKRVILRDNILILPKSKFISLIKKVFSESSELILSWISIGREFGGYVVKERNAIVWGSEVIRVSSIICEGISDYIRGKYRKNYEIVGVIYYKDDLNENFFEVVVAHEILEMGMTYYVPAISLKVSGVFSEDLKIFSDQLSEWMVYNVLGYKNGMKERVKGELERNFGKSIAEKYLELELYMRSEHFSLRELEKRARGNPLILALASSLKRSAILLRLGEENIFREFLEKYSKVNVRDMLSKVNEVYAKYEVIANAMRGKNF